MSQIRSLATAAFLIFGTSLLTAQPTLVAHWSFDEVSGATAQDSKGGFHGTLAGGAVFVTGGISGNAVSLNTASGSLVNMGTAVPGFTTGDFSLVAWIKTTTTASMIVVGKHESGSFNGYFFGLNTSSGYGTAGKAYFYNSTAPGGEAISTTSVNDGNWHQLVGVHVAGGNLSIYIDGVLERTLTSQAIGGNAAPFLVGGINVSGTPTAALTGWVDDVQLYSSALSPSEVQTLFLNPGQTTAIPEPSAAGLWMALAVAAGLAVRQSRKRAN